MTNILKLISITIQSPSECQQNSSVQKTTSETFSVLFPADSEGKEWGPLDRLADSLFGQLAGWAGKRDILSRIQNRGRFSNEVVVRSTDKEHHEKLLAALPSAFEALLGVAAAPLA